MTFPHGKIVSFIDTHAGIQRHFNGRVLELGRRLVDFGHERRKERLMQRQK